jgi:mRNA-degrading endonuclease toxin of MazEF toxin-antitoxin module
MKNESSLFDNWNEKKKFVEKVSSPIFHEREVWWCSLGKNIGSEEDGKGDGFERPVYVFKKYNSEIFLGIPLTSKYKENKYHYRINENESSTIILSQIKLMSGKRLLRQISKVSRGKHFEIKNKLLEIL